MLELSNRYPLQPWRMALVLNRLRYIAGGAQHCATPLLRLHPGHRFRFQVLVSPVGAFSKDLFQASLSSLKPS